jgi:hypothetical protein
MRGSYVEIVSGNFGITESHPSVAGGERELVTN